MNVLNIEQASKIYGDKKILDSVSLGVREGEKIGIIGLNGTGKSTLLRLIGGQEMPDSGQVVRLNGLKLGFLSQNPGFPEGHSVLSYVLGHISDTDYTAQSKARSMLNKLGITDHAVMPSELSGGQKKRAALAKVLCEPCDVLLLDEPTNHLDNEMISWLEDYLSRFGGVVIMVTHDRYFLDKIVGKIVEISHGKLYSYASDYSGFLEQKAQREEMELASERKRQSVLRMETEWAKRGCQARSTKQKARLQRLESLKNGGAPVKEQTLELDLARTRMGKKTVEFKNVGKSMGGRRLIEDFSYIFLKNQRLGIIGPNGCGKSTLLKILAGIMEPDEGQVEVGETVKIGYFAQEVPDMEDTRRVIDYVRDIAEYIPTTNGRITASQMLERFLFSPDMQYAPVGKLSGGEKKRLYLLGILQAAPNFLVLDEVSNDIDIPTLTILEDYLTAFQGIVVTVSHDRYFLDNVADRIFEFDGPFLRQYEGGYTEYLEAKERCGKAEAAEKTGNRKQDKSKIQSKKDWKINSPVRLKFTFKEQKEYETIDSDIEALETRIAALEHEIMENGADYEKLSKLTKEQEAAENELELLLDRWTYLNELAERIEESRK